MSKLIVANGENEGAEYSMDSSIVSLGRSPSNTIVLDDRRMSRFHAEILRRGSGYYIRDLGSKNGTFLNDRQLQHESPLKARDRIQLGDTCLTVELDGELHALDSTASKMEYVDKQWGETRSRLNADLALTGAYILPAASEHDKIKLHYETLSQVAEATRLVLDLDELLEKITDLVLEVFQPDRCVIMIHDEASGEMLPRVVRNNALTREKEVKVSRTIIEQAVRQQMSLLVSDTSGDKRFNAVESIMSHNIRTAICSPMICNKFAYGILYIDTQTRLLSYNEDDLELFTNIAALAAGSLANAQLHQKLVAQARVERDLEIAGEIQRNLLPSGVPRIEGFDVAAVNLPARQVGGDFYDFIEADHHKLGVALADVSGKGVSAAILASSIRSALQVKVKHSFQLVEEMIDDLNRMTFRDTTAAMYSTLVFGILDPRKRNFTYVNCGHNYPLLFQPDGRYSELRTGGTLLGIGGDSRYQSECVELAPETVLVIYSDGLIEARNAAGEFWGEQRLIETIRQHRSLPAGELCARIIQQAKAHQGDAETYDDMTLLIIRSSFFDEDWDLSAGGPSVEATANSLL